MYPKFKYFNFPSALKYRRYYSTEKFNQFQIDDQNGAILDVQHGSYGSKLLDPRWKLRRLQVLKRDSNQCVICNCTEELQIHHRQYHYIIQERRFKDPWEYDDNLLITLCENCHQRGHNKYKVPTIKI